jgi:hypothetical protein
MPPAPTISALSSHQVRTAGNATEPGHHPGQGLVGRVVVVADAALVQEHAPQPEGPGLAGQQHESRADRSGEGQPGGGRGPDPPGGQKVGHEDQRGELDPGRDAGGHPLPPAAGVPPEQVGRERQFGPPAESGRPGRQPAQQAQAGQAQHDHADLEEDLGRQRGHAHECHHRSAPAAWPLGPGHYVHRGTKSRISAWPL